MNTISRNIEQSFDDLLEAAKKAEVKGPKDPTFRKAEADKLYNKKVLGRKASGRRKLKVRPVRGTFKVLRRLATGKLNVIVKSGVPEGRLTARALRKLGFGVGGKYKYVVPGTGKVIQIKILKRTADGVICRNVKTGTQFSATKVDMSHFL